MTARGAPSASPLSGSLARNDGQRSAVSFAFNRIAGSYANVNVDVVVVVDECTFAFLRHPIEAISHLP